MKSETKENCPPRYAKKSKIPVVKSSTGKKFKTRPAPDFKQLHKKWQHEFEMGKACHKKPCTSAHEFNLTKSGTKFERPKTHPDLDDVYETEFLEDQEALESIVSDKGLNRDELSGRATTGTIGKTRRKLPFESPLGSNRRKVLGELSPNPKCVKRSGSTLLDKQKESAIGDLFQKDERALRSILNHTGVSTNTSNSNSGFRQTFAGGSGAPSSTIRTSIYYIPPKLQPASTNEAYTAYKNMVLNKVGINSRSVEKLQPRGESKDQMNEEKFHTSPLQPSESSCKPNKVGPSQTFQHIPDNLFSSPSSPVVDESSKGTISKSHSKKDHDKLSHLHCEQSPFVMSSPFGRGSICIPHRNSIYATYKSQLSVASPLVTNSARKLAVSPVSAKRGLHTVSEIPNSEHDSRNIAGNNAHASTLLKVCDGSQSHFEHGDRNERSIKSSSSVFCSPIGQGPSSSSVFCSPIGQGPVAVPQKQSIYASYQSPMFKSPAVGMLPRNKTSDTLTPSFKRIPKKSPVSCGPRRVQSSVKREKKNITWADVLQSPAPENSFTESREGKLATTLFFPTEHEEIDAEPVPTLGGGFSIDGRVYSTTDPTRHNQRDDSSNGQDGVSHHLLPVVLANTGSPLPDLPHVIASGNGSHSVQEWIRQTELGAGRGHEASKHASLDDYSSRLQKLEIQETLLGEVIKGNTMAMQTTDSSNEQSSSSQKKETAQRSASGSESRCSGKPSASQQKTSVEELNESISESKSQIVQLEQEMEVLQQTPVHDGNGNKSDSEEILRQLDMVRQQQQQLLQVQLQLQQQLQTQMVAMTTPSVDKNSNVCHTKLEIREHNNNNVHTSSCDNTNVHPVDENLQMQLSKMADIEFPGADNDPVHRAGLEELESTNMQSDPKTSSSAGQKHYKLDTAEKINNPESSGTSLQHVPDSVRSFKHHQLEMDQIDSSTNRQLPSQCSSFTPVRTKDNTDFELTPYLFKEPLAKTITSQNQKEQCLNLVTPKPQKSPVEPVDNVSNNICPPIWTPLALGAAAQQQSLSCEKEQDSIEQHSRGLQTQLSFDSIDSDVDNRNGNSPNISQSAKNSSSNQHQYSAFPGVRMTTSEHNLDNSLSIGSLSLRASTPDSNRTVSHSSTNQSLYRRAVLNSNERFHEALLDEECALYMCRLQHFFKPSFIDRGFNNPIARILTEGDDMHFVPIWEDNVVHTAIQGSAFSCYSA